MKLHIIASCTDGKRFDPPGELRLRNVPSGPVERRMADWWRRLSAWAGIPWRAAELYKGHHWAEVLDLPEAAREAGFEASLWVASAGYGMVSSDSAIQPYSATFGFGMPDSVATGEEGAQAHGVNQEWWRLLGMQRLAGDGRPRSLATLAASDRKATFLVVASPVYVIAMQKDLIAVAETLAEPARLLLVTGTDNAIPVQLKPNLIPVAAALTTGGLGGTRISLHGRVAQKILAEADRWPLRADVLRPRYERLISESPAPPRLQRTTMSDNEVRAFIVSELRKAPLAACTPLLRSLRDSGRACEQSRFRDLYREVKGGGRVA